MSFNGNWSPSTKFFPPVAQVHQYHHYLQHQEQGPLHIPRPILTVIQVPEDASSAQNSINLPPTPPSSLPSNELTMSVNGSFIYDRCETPTRFTLLGESGVVRNRRTTPTTCQLSMTFCTLALLALVGMIVYMEVYMNGSQV
uniref:Uncharacterized protein n=1 Tax=Daphnia galeata TaxID=27404 RepID=A0A8J2RPA3_9CRUS|nr:unnamed protein product [Daphnia galeata]